MTKAKIEYSDYQKLIFKEINSGTNNMAVIARAGVGKTFSLIHSLKFVPKGKKVMLAAFNKSIANELKDRCPPYVDCNTIHSFGYSAVKKRFGSDVQFFGGKMHSIYQQLVDPKKQDLMDSLCEFTTLCKSCLADYPSKIKYLIKKHSINTCDLTEDEYISVVIKGLDKCKKITKQIDYGDMIYFPYVYNLSIGKYDYIFIDEAQDMSPAQLKIALSAAHETSKIIIFLDPKQAIYSFMGADIKNVEETLEQLSAKQFKLPITYRCPKNVVFIAQKYAADFQYTKDAPDGEVKDILDTELLDYVKKGDFILSRTNAPLIKICMKLIKNKIPANIQGSDIADNLIWFINKSNTKSIDAFKKYLEKYRKKEIAKLVLENKSIEYVQDRVETLENLCENAKTVQELLDLIKALFTKTDDRDKIILSSTHKAKGLERDNVFLLWDTFKQTSEEEKNISYVAITRARKKLYFIYKYNKPEVSTFNQFLSNEIVR